jgi:hypothetical protein
MKKKNNNVQIRVPGTCPNCQRVAVNDIQLSKYTHDKMVVLPGGALSPHTNSDGKGCLGSWSTQHKR